MNAGSVVVLPFPFVVLLAPVIDRASGDALSLVPDRRCFQLPPAGILDAVRRAALILEISGRPIAIIHVAGCREELRRGAPVLARPYRGCSLPQPVAGHAEAFFFRREPDHGLYSTPAWICS